MEGLISNYQIKDFLTKEAIICHPDVHRQISPVIILRRLQCSLETEVITTRFEKLKIGTKLPTSKIKVLNYES